MIIIAVIISLIVLVIAYMILRPQSIPAKPVQSVKPTKPTMGKNQNPDDEESGVRDYTINNTNSNSYRNRRSYVTYNNSMNNSNNRVANTNTASNSNNVVPPASTVIPVMSNNVSDNNANINVNSIVRNYTNDDARVIKDNVSVTTSSSSNAAGSAISVVSKDISGIANSNINSDVRNYADGGVRGSTVSSNSNNSNGATIDSRSVVNNTPVVAGSTAAPLLRYHN